MKLSENLQNKKPLLKRLSVLFYFVPILIIAVIISVFNFSPNYYKQENELREKHNAISAQFYSIDEQWFTFCTNNEARKFREGISFDSTKYDYCKDKANFYGAGITYLSPYDLFYTYLKDESPYISQGQREHYDRNGLLATDVATGGKHLDMYAPDIKNKEVEYVVTRWSFEDYPELGEAMILTSGLERFIIGHIKSSLVDDDEVKTGDIIGSTLCPGDDKAGATTGCHAHIMYQIGTERNEGIDWAASEYRLEHNYLKHNEWKEKRDSPLAGWDVFDEGDEDHTAWNDEVYQNKETPAEILSCVHLRESGRQKIQEKTSTAGAIGTMQFLPYVWDAYCPDLEVGNLEDDIECANRYLYENFKEKGSWWDAVWQYNHVDWYVNFVLECSADLGYDTAHPPYEVQ